MSDWLTHPSWAPALLGGWLVLALLTGLALQRARRVLRRLGVRPPRIAAARDGGLIVAALLLVVALLGPHFGTRRVEVPGHGIDVVLLLDVSRSMDARDTPPTRLVRAREAALALLRGLGPGDRAALAVFAGHAALLTPLTADHRALAEMLPALDSEMMSDRGSELARGVSAALEAFDPQSLRPGVIVALGDGERGWRIANEDVARLRHGAVRFVAGAIGSDEGSPIRIGTGLLRDARGKVVTSRRDTRGFARLAEVSGGSLLLADEWGSFEPNALTAAVREGLVPGPGGTVHREVPVSYTGLLAALAFLVLVAEALSDSRRLRRLTAGTGLAVLLVAATPAEVEELEARVRRHPDDATTLVALGVARARAGNPEEAARAFAAAAVRARTREEAALASYDLGVARLEAGDFAGARDAFFDAAALAPDDREARFNLEWALRALAAEPPPTPRPGDEPNDVPPRDDASGPTEPEESAPDEAEAPEPTASTARLPRSPAALSPEEISQWLEAVEDRPEAAFRAALEEDGTRRSGPQW